MDVYEHVWDRYEYEHWLLMREYNGDLMEHQFRVLFSIPIVLPRVAMKRIFLYAADDDMEDTFGAPLWWVKDPPSTYL